jgi:hypothetical protein
VDLVIALEPITCLQWTDWGGSAGEGKKQTNGDDKQAVLAYCTNTTAVYLYQPPKDRERERQDGERVGEGEREREGELGGRVSKLEHIFPENKTPFNVTSLKWTGRVDEVDARTGVDIQLMLLKGKESFCTVKIGIAM